MGLSTPYYGIGCAIVDDHLYTIGGNQEKAALKLHVNSDSEWEVIDTSASIGMYPSVVSAYSGLFAVKDLSIFFFNSTSKAWTNQLPPERQQSTSRLAKNDLIPSELLTYDAGSLRILDSVRRRWSTSHLFFGKTKDEAIAAYQGDLYVLDGFTAGIFDRLFIIDMRKFRWKSVHVTGTLPPKLPHLTWTQHEQSIYLVDQSSLYILDLITLNWQLHHIEGFTGYSSGCLAFHDEYLIHAFGSENNSTTPQRVDIKTLTLYKPSFSHLVFPISIAVLMIILVIAILCYLIRKEFLGKPVYPPEMLNYPLWSDPCLTNCSHIDHFTHYSEIDDQPPSVFIRRRTNSIPAAIKSYMANHL